MALKYKWRTINGSLFREPSAINGMQVATNTAAAVTGLLAALGGIPNLLTGQIGPVLSAVVGTVLMIGGVLGAVSVLFGNWWLERVALLITGLGWTLMFPAALSYAISGRSSGGVWLVVALLFAAVGDVVKRYLRIQWAYLDPQK